MKITIECWYYPEELSTEIVSKNPIENAIGYTKTVNAEIKEKWGKTSDNFYIKKES